MRAALACLGLLLILAPGAAAAKTDVVFKIDVAPTSFTIEGPGSQNMTARVEAKIECDEPTPIVGGPMEPPAPPSLYINQSYLQYHEQQSWGWAYRILPNQKELKWQQDASNPRLYRVKESLHVVVESNITPDRDIDHKPTWEVSSGGGSSGMCTRDGYRNVFTPVPITVHVEGSGRRSGSASYAVPGPDVTLLLFGVASLVALDRRR